MVVLLEVPPISTQDLWSSARVTIGFLVTSLTLLPRLLSLATFRKSPGCSKLPFKNYGGHCALENLQRSRHFSTQSCLWALQAVPSTFALICIVSCETFYRQVCAFQNWIEFTTGGLQSSVIAMGQNTCQCDISVFPLQNKFAQISRILFSLCLYRVLSVDRWGKKLFSMILAWGCNITKCEKG